MKNVHAWIGTLTVVLVLSVGLAIADDPAATTGDDGFEDVGQAAAQQAAPTEDAGAAPDETATETTEERIAEEEVPENRPQSPLSKWLMPAMIGGFILLWIFMSRGRKKQAAKRRDMLQSLQKGERVITIGGIVGTIIEARDDELVVKVDDNTRMKFARWAVRTAGEDVKEEKKKDSQEQR